jgi:HlyD family secretion protein
MSATTTRKSTSMNRSRRWLVISGGVAALVLVSALVAGCQHSGGEPPAASAAAAVPQVTVVSPRRQTLTRLIEQPGYIRAYEQTPIYSKIAGYAEEPQVDISDTVKEGDLLLRLWVPELEQDLKAKEARVTQAGAEVTQAEEGLKAAKANVDTAEAVVTEAKAAIDQAEADYQRWKAEFDRGSRLITQNLYDRQTLDEARSQMQQADAGRGRARARLASTQAALVESKARRGKAEADVTAARARLQVAEADRSQSQAWLDYRDIRAPYNGVITLRNVHKGHFLQSSSSGSTNKAAEPLFVMVRMDKMRINVQVPEYDAVLVKKDMPAAVRFQALPEKEFPAKVTRYTWAFDDQARTLRAEIHIDNPPSLELRPGMYANVTIRANVPDVLTLPAAALLDEGDKMYCFVVEDGKAVRTAVKLGVHTKQTVQVLKKQGKPGGNGEEAPWEDFSGKEEIVAHNPASLLDGQTVTVKGRDQAEQSARR